MDEELKQFLTEIKTELTGMRTEIRGLNTRIEKSENDLHARIEKSENDLYARIEKTETNLLRAFHGWGRTMEIRQRAATTTVAGFDERLIFLEERVSELERGKLN